MSGRAVEPDAPPPTLFVPVVLTEVQALHTLGALRAVIESATLVGEAAKAAPLAQAMLALAEATDRARENRGG